MQSWIFQHADLLLINIIIIICIFFIDNCFKTVYIYLKYIGL